MISPKKFYNWLATKEIDFFSGVPDSLLKDICGFITDNTPKTNHIIAANEGNAIAIAAGYHMATNKVTLVYMQNSGIGNAVNPLLSLTDKKVYNIPLLLMIGWRGEPGVKDEPQHISQGEVTLDLLQAMKVPFTVISKEESEAKEQIEKAISNIKLNNEPHALVIKKGTFEKYTIKENIESSYELSREKAIEQIVNLLEGNEIIVSTTGKTSRELFEIREALGHSHNSDFLTVGSMGHASQIALGIAIAKPNRKVICLDGDGALLMHAGSLAINGAIAPNNLIHIVINNGAHESVGGQPTVAFNIDIPKIAQANGYKTGVCVENGNELKNTFSKISENNCPALIEIKVKVGSRENLGRPTILPVDNKSDFMKNLNK